MLCSCQPTVGSDDDIMLESAAPAGTAMDSHDNHFALLHSTITVFQLGSFALTMNWVIGLNLDAHCGSANFLCPCTMTPGGLSSSEWTKVRWLTCATV
jgi:hypothetical protein